MLLVIDVGNTNTVLGLYRDEALLHRWRVTTDPLRTSDEYAALFHELFRLVDIPFTALRDVAISSVVPPLVETLTRLCRDYLDCSPCVVGPEVKTGINIRYDDPHEVGPDRIVNTVAAYAKHRCALIVVDFGTATTFDYITADGCYLGGAIAPGLGISADALSARTSKLPRVDFARPDQAIATNTLNSIQSGLFYGYIGLVDGIVARMKLEAEGEPLTLATGGLAGVIAEASATIELTDPDLTLEGLRIIHERNKQCFDTPESEC